MPFRDGTFVEQSGWQGQPARASDNAGAPWYVGPAHPEPWTDIVQPIGIDQTAAMQGQPPPLSWWQRRVPLGPQVPPQPFPVWQVHPGYDRGAEAFTPHFGIVQYNPIGAGVYAPYRHPTIAGPGATYKANAIWFDVQTIGTGLRINPTIPMETVNALIATSHATFGYYTSG